MSRDIKSGGSLLNAASLLDRTKVYTYDASGNIVEVDGTTVTLGDNDLVFSGSKSNLRRMADLERNVSILATRLTDGSIFDREITATTTFSGDVTIDTLSTLEVNGVLGTNFTEKLQDLVGLMVTGNTLSGISVTYDDTLGKLNFSVTDSFVNTTGDTMSGILNMGGNFIQNLATPLLSTDAASKGYVDSAVSNEVANVAQYTSWFFSDGTNLSEITDGGSLVINPGTNISIAYNATSDEYTISSTDTTYTAGAGISLTGTEFSVAGGPGLVAGSTGLSHADTSSVSNLTASGRTYVTGLTFDGFGHVTGYTTGTETVVDTNDIDYINAASFNTTTGVLTLSGVGNAGATVDLDGRYALSGHTHNYDNYVSWNISDGVNNEGIASGDTLKIVGSGASSTSYDAATNTLTISSTDTNDIDYINAASFNTGTGVLTLSGVGNAGATVDLDGRYLQSETVTSLSLSTNTLSYVDENGTTTNIDLSLYLDDTNLARIVSGSVNGTTGIATFSRDDATTFTVDFSALFDDTNLTRITGGTFNTSDGVLTLTRSDASTAASIDLDGRYQIAGSYDNYVSWTASDGTNTAAITSGETVVLSGSGATTVAFNPTTQTYTISSTDTNTDTTYSAGTGISLAGTTFSHADTSTATNLSASGRRYVTGLTFDGFGHVTGYTTGTETVTDTNDIDYINAASFNTTTGVLTLSGVGNAGATVDLDGRYLQSESDTLATVTARGSSTTAGITVNGDITVTGNVDGRDLSADGTKLDGIEAGATADQTKADIDALGINAATLDSLDSSQFLRSDVADTVGGKLTFNDTATFIDGVAAKWGTSGDLEIVRDLGTTYITNLTGLLMINSVSGTEIEHNGYTKLATNAGGIDVTGNITSSGTVKGENMQVSSATPTIFFNGTNDGGDGASSDFAIKATPEGLDFYEPEDGNKLHFQIQDDTGVNAVYGYKWNGQSLDDRYHPKGTYDNYVSWTLYTDGTSRGGITSGEVVNFVGGTNVSLSYSSTNNTITINSTDTDTNNYVNGLSFNTTNGVLTATRSGLGDLTVDLDGRYLTSYAETDTLDSVTDRGNSTSNAITVGAITTTGDAVVGGNLTVNGTVTTVNTEEINLADNIIILNSNETGTPTQSAGIEVERGTSTNVSFLWDETNDTWTAGSASITAGQFIGSFQGTSTESTTANVANAWAVARTLTLTGDVLGSVTWDGSADVTMTTNIASALDNYVQWIASDHDGTTYTITSGDVLKFAEGSGMDVNFTADDVLTFTNTDRGSSQNIFKNVQIQNEAGTAIGTSTADSNNDTLYLREVQVSSTNGINLTQVADDVIGIAHADTSSQSSSINSGRTYIQTITLDAYGHITGINTATETVVNTDTLGKNIVGASSTATTNASATNGNVWINHIEGSSTIKSAHKIVGSGATIVTADADGYITVNSTDTNTWRPIHDSPVDGATTTSISSNWAFDNVKTPVPSGAVFTDTVYSHPTHPGDDINIDTGPLTGATVISDLDFNVTTDTNGHVTDANGTFSTRNLTLADLGFTGSPVADNYGSWTLYTDNTSRGGITSGEVVNFVGGSNVSLVYSSTNNTITINSTDTNTTNFNIQANGGTQVNISAGEEINFVDGNATTAVVVNQTNPTVTFHHNDTSTQPSVNNSNGTVIQDVFLDTYGHVTGLNSVNLDGRYLQSYTETDTLDSVTDRGNTTTNEIGVSGVNIDSVYNLNSATSTLSTTAQTGVAIYTAANYAGAKLVVSARNTVTGETQMSEILVTNTSTSAVATEYGVVHTGASCIASYDVDVSGGSVRLLITGASASQTKYQISANFIKV